MINAKRTEVNTLFDASWETLILIREKKNSKEYCEVKCNYLIDEFPLEEM